MILTPSSCSRDAAPRVSSPPIAISASTPRPSRLSRIRCTPVRPPSVADSPSGLVRDEPRIVPPRGRMPRTAGMSSGTVSPSSGPRQPSRKPMNSYPNSVTPRRTTARITAFRPGQSPPPVSTPTRIWGLPLVVSPERVAAVGRPRPGLGSAGRKVHVLSAFGKLPVGLAAVPGAPRVPVHVLLTGQLHDRVHNLVGDRAQHDPVGLQAVVPGEVQRLAEPDPGPDRQPRPDRARRLELERADHRAGHDRGPGLQCQPRHAGLAAVQAAVRTAGALGVDAQHIAPGQDPQPGAQGPLAGLAAGPVDRDLPDTTEKSLADQALQTAPGEILGLGEKHDLPRERQRREEVIGERQVVARDDDRSRPGDLLRMLRPRAEQDPQQRAEDRLHRPVIHDHMLPRGGAAAEGLPRAGSPWCWPAAPKPPAPRPGRPRQDGCWPSAPRRDGCWPAGPRPEQPPRSWR